MTTGWTIIQFAHLECVNLTTNNDKFYKIYLAKGPDGQFIVGASYGRNGTLGQVKNYADASSHIARFNALYLSKKKGGKYIDVSPPASSCNVILPDGMITMLPTPKGATPLPTPKGATPRQQKKQVRAHFDEIVIKAITTRGPGDTTFLWLLKGDGWYVPYTLTQVAIARLDSVLTSLDSISEPEGFVEIRCLTDPSSGRLEPLEVITFLTADCRSQCLHTQLDNLP